MPAEAASGSSNRSSGARGVRKGGASSSSGAETLIIGRGCFLGPE
jgi:hypothetical protein